MKSFENARGVNEETFVEMLDAGGVMAIVCIASAERSTSNFPGRWHLYVSDDARQNWSQLELFAKKQIREFRSSVGLTGFMLDKGFVASVIPLKQGDHVEVSKDGDIRFYRA